MELADHCNNSLINDGSRSRTWWLAWRTWSTADYTASSSSSLTPILDRCLRSQLGIKAMMMMVMDLYADVGDHFEWLLSRSARISVIMIVMKMCWCWWWDRRKWWGKFENTKVDYNLMALTWVNNWYGKCNQQHNTDIASTKSNGKSGFSNIWEIIRHASVSSTFPCL